ncbi:hypothetical protein EI94DRAFT_1813020 [Lactarius quietus]|nr:hypothetical protein EI94DRAFT_1813020 [Lactarius quietus]
MSSPWDDISILALNPSSGAHCKGSQPFLTKASPFMPPKLQQLRNKDGKFLLKNSKSGQPPSSLTTPSTSKHKAREASPTNSTVKATPSTQPTSHTRSTSQSHSKHPQPPPNSPSTQPSADSMQPSSDSMQPSSDSTQPSADSTQPSSNSTQPSSDLKQPASNPGQSLESSKQPENSSKPGNPPITHTHTHPLIPCHPLTIPDLLLLPLLREVIKTIISMHPNEGQDPHSSFLPPATYLPPPPALTTAPFNRFSGHACSQIAVCPRFSGKDDKIMSEFLHEYEDLVDGNGLMEKQTVETILHYVSHSLHNFWKTLPSYRAASWFKF